MKINLLLLILLLCAIIANSQTSESKQFLEVFKELRTPDNQPIKCYENKDNKIEQRILFEYGAVYVSKGAILPEKCLMTMEQTKTFIRQFQTSQNKFSFGDFYLQPQAKAELDQAFNELGGYIYLARNCNRTTTCTNGVNDDWAIRDFGQALFNWNKNKPNGLSGRQIVMDNTRAKPFIFSYAIPGASQHHLGLAVDVINGGRNRLGNQISGENRSCDDNEDCLKTLEKHFWFRTIRGDPFHFTYLGFARNELPAKGLKEVSCKEPNSNKSYKYWVPNVSENIYKSYENNTWRCSDV